MWYRAKKKAAESGGDKDNQPSIQKGTSILSLSSAVSHTTSKRNVFLLYEEFSPLKGARIGLWISMLLTAFKFYTHNGDDFPKT